MLLWGVVGYAQNQQPAIRSSANGVLPITGTWINLAYQDVRNKYTNPAHFDNTDPQMWEQKIEELSKMGVEYLVFMAVANEGKSFYPSKLMPRAYAESKRSPVEAILDAADRLGLKVFMSTGWAQNQDDNLRLPEVKSRQIEMMEELVALFAARSSFYGWYLPVEDCLCPILSDYAIEAVNTLTNRARELTPEKKIMISPYGLVDSDLDNPKYEAQLARLKIDIIAYQDEVGCVREPYPLVRLKKNWKKLRAIHDRLGIEMWANCETFTWERETNSRTSALIPAAYERILNQQVLASQHACVDRIISFMVCGIIESPASNYQLGQPTWSNVTYENYMAWLNGDRYWRQSQAMLLGELRSDPFCVEEGLLSDNVLAEATVDDTRWVRFEAGHHEIKLDLSTQKNISLVLLRLLNCAKANAVIPQKIYLFTSSDGIDYHLAAINNGRHFPNANHDAWIDAIEFDKIDCSTRYMKIAFSSDLDVYIDEVYVNPHGNSIE